MRARQSQGACGESGVLPADGVAPGAEQPGLLLAWVRFERSGEWAEWQAIVSWIRSTGVNETKYQRITPIIRAAGLRPMEQREAYQAVPRLLVHSDGRVTRPEDNNDGEDASPEQTSA